MDWPGLQWTGLECINWLYVLNFTYFAAEPWSRGAVEPWSCGAVKPWSCGAVEPWSCGAMEPWSRVDVEEPWSRGAVESWSRGAVEPWSRERARCDVVVVACLVFKTTVCTRCPRAVLVEILRCWF